MKHPLDPIADATPMTTRRISQYRAQFALMLRNANHTFDGIGRVLRCTKNEARTYVARGYRILQDR